MDLVDIDKVLDDFELNENDDKEVKEDPKIQENDLRLLKKENEDNTQNITKDSEDNIKPVNMNQQSTSSNKNFVNVSNVFTSLNEYVAVEINEKTDNSIKLNQENTPSSHPSQSQSKSRYDDSSQSSDSMIIETKNSHHRVKKHPIKYVQRLPMSYYDSTLDSTSPESSTPTSSRRSSISTSSNLSENDETNNFLTKSNENLIPSNPDDGDDDEERILDEQVDECKDLPNTSTNSSQQPINTNNNTSNKTNTIYSSSSSYCYNENNSSDVTFNNDIVSLNETSSLSSLVNISTNNDNDDDDKTISELLPTQNDTNTNNIQFIDGSIENENEKLMEPGIQLNKPEDKQEQPPMQEQDQVNTKSVVGFESTMDDVSDTELESYLQELELEANANQVNDEENIEIDKKLCASEDIEEPSINLIENEAAEISEDSLTTHFCDENKEKSVDNISQASTVECNDNISSQIEIERIQSEENSQSVSEIEINSIENKDENICDSKLINESQSSGDQIEKIENEHNEIVSPEIDENKDNSLQEETGNEISDIKTNNESGDTSNLNQSNQPKRPSSLSIQSSISEQIPNQDQTPSDSQVNEPIQLSTSSSDDVASASIFNTNNSEENSSRMLVNQLGKIQPYWVPDADALNCMKCNLKFSFVKRRHHCRACGKVLCSTCCSSKAKLEFLGDMEARVCQQCETILNNPNRMNDYSVLQQNPYPPDPNNPMEYCSRLPPHEQITQQQNAPISVMVPVGVLKREGASRVSRKEKNVIFSDGIRPGSDLTEIDHNWDSRSSSSGGSRKPGSRRVQTPPDPTAAKLFRNTFKLPPVDPQSNSYIPKTENSLPPILVSNKTDYKFIEVTNNSQLLSRIQNEELKFAIQRNFYVNVKIINLNCCINKNVINFTTEGLRYVGQDEIIILLEINETHTTIPKDIFIHLNEIYLNADKGQTITELGYSIPRQPNFLDSREHGGFLYIRPTFQCLHGIIKAEPPFLVGILIHRWELPWAKIFPLRLMLRLGALYRYYPSPLVSERGRDSVFVEIAQTVINLLADFRAYSYTLATIRGMIIHMENRQTTLYIPRNRYDQVMKAINNSSDHILALGAVFSKKADGHLVCIQNTESGCPEKNQYSTHAINIQGKPCKITGASFLILNGALKSSSGLSGKCTIVEDGLMVQILQQTMISARDALKNLKDFNIVCGLVDAPSDQTETVSLVWTDDDLEFNIGVISPIDSKKMDGVPSIRVHKSLEYPNSYHILRWTEVFILKSDDDTPNDRVNDHIDISKISEKLAKSTANALVSYLDLLATNGLTKLGLRVTLDPENVGYEAGSQQSKLPPLYMKALDNELIPTLHRQASNFQMDTSIILELIFHILDK